MTDPELMKRYQVGDMTAFNEIYERHHGRVYGYLKKRIRDPKLVDDIFQLVFMKFHSCRQQYQPEHPVSAWLFTITRSVMIDELRKQSKMGQNISIEAISDLAEKKELETPGINLESLTPEERDLIQDRYFDDKSFETIAIKLGLTPSATRKRLSRTLSKLRNKLIKGSP